MARSGTASSHPRPLSCSSAQLRPELSFLFFLRQKSIFPPSSLAVVRISSLNYKTRNLSSSIYENRLFLHLGWFRRLFVPRWTVDTATTLTPFQRMRPAAERNPRPFPSLLSSLSLRSSKTMTTTEKKDSQ